MLIFNSTPCEKQAKVMDSLKFMLTCTTMQGMSVWAGYGIHLSFDDEYVPSIEEVLSKLVDKARAQGKERLQNQIKSILGILEHPLQSFVDKR